MYKALEYNESEVKDALILYLSESNRQIEEKFVRGLSGIYSSELYFDLSDNCSDGKKIYIAPQPITSNNIKSFNRANRHFKAHFNSIFNAIRWETRGTVIHEAGHNMFSGDAYPLLRRLPSRYAGNNLHIAKDIANIIEDGYIEKRLRNAYKGADKYLSYSNIRIYFERPRVSKIKNPLMQFIEVALDYTVVGRIKGTPSAEVQEYWEKAEPFFKKGKCSDKAKDRFECTYAIMDIIKPLIENNKYEAQPQSQNGQGRSGASGTQSNGSSNGANTPSTQYSVSMNPNSRGISASELPENARLSTAADTSDDKKENGSGEKEEEKSNKNSGTAQKNDKKSENSQRQNGNSSEKENSPEKSENKTAQSEIGKDIEAANNDPQEEIVKRTETAEQENTQKQKQNDNMITKQTAQSVSSNHSNINCVMKEAPADISSYNAIFAKNKETIRSATTKIRKLLNEKDEGFETKLEIGSRLDTTRFGDKSRRFWKEERDIEPAKLRISVLVDCSGSTSHIMPDMQEALVILAETAHNLKVPIQIIGMNACYGRPVVEHIRTVGFSDNFNLKKFRICGLASDSNTREGYSLEWLKNSVEKTRTSNMKDLIIVLSDGYPYHSSGNSTLTGEAAQQDAKRVADKVARQNCDLIALALGSEELKIELSKIYKKVYPITDMTKLPEVLLTVLRRNLLRK